MAEISSFLIAPGTIFDVRSPKEFSQGHIPGAINLPLFSDLERAAVGTLYKKVGRQAAIEEGLKIVGPKLFSIVDQVKKCNLPLAKVHCWRGGMRSSSVAWLLDLAGIKTETLKGGYKAFRRWVLQQLAMPRILAVLGGATGSGKTEILHALKEQGEQILDLEGLAVHRGSAYGKLNNDQPSYQQFENAIAVELSKLDPAKTTWVEDESHLIGSCKVPKVLFDQMHAAPLFIIECPLEERLERLISGYGSVDVNLLIESTKRISRRLGSLRTTQVINALQAGNMADAARCLLDYYDKAYAFHLSRRPQQIQAVSGHGLSSSAWAQKLKSFY